MPVTSNAATVVRRRPWLFGDEAVTFTLGIGLILLLVGLILAVGYWTHWSQRGLSRQARVEQLRGIGDSLGQACEMLLANGDVSSMRNLVVRARQRYGLADCRVTLPGERVIADSDPARITLVNLPAKWTDVPADAPAAGETSGRMTLAFPLLAPGKGMATLTISAAVEGEASFFTDLQAGVAAIGALGLLAALMVYRQARSRVVPLGALRSAVLAAGAGQQSADALTITRFAGPEMSAWNALVAERASGYRKALTSSSSSPAGGRRDEGELEQLCDAMPTGLIVADEAARVVYANGAAAVFLQRGREQLMGADLTEVAAQDAVKQAIRETAAGASRVRKTLVVDHGHGPEATVLRFGVRPLGRQGGQRVMVTIEDITQQRIAEESRNSFVAHVAHELRTPLTNIRLYVDTALTDGEKDATLRGKCLNVINQESRRLELMIGEILSVAEIDAGSLKLAINDLRLDTLLEELISDYQAQAAEKKIRFVAELPPKFPVARADRDRLALALHNMMGNAFKYTPPGGSVTLRVKAEGGLLQVEVADSGIGIDAEEAERIFDRFYRSKDPRVGKITGTGLGLTLSRQIARQHGGDITVESALNKGSTFTLKVPIGGQAG